jgi:hypothetical protein
MTCVAVVLAIGGLVSCGNGGSRANTITLDQATRRAHELFDQAVGQLPGAVVVSLGAEDPYPCDDPTDGGPQGRMIISVEKRIDGLDKTRYNSYFDLLRDYWQRNGFRLLDDSRPKDMYLWVESIADGFRTSLEANDRGEFYMTTSSPCIWPNGTPAPS